MSVALYQRLAQLAAELGDRQAACEAALNDAVGHAIRAGELLIEAKGPVARGDWRNPSRARTARASMT